MGLANMDGGDLRRGSGTKYDVAQVTPVFFRHAVELTKLWTTTRAEFDSRSDRAAATGDCHSRSRRRITLRTCYGTGTITEYFCAAARSQRPPSFGPRASDARRFIRDW